MFSSKKSAPALNPQKKVTPKVKSRDMIVDPPAPNVKRPDLIVDPPVPPKDKRPDLIVDPMAPGTANKLVSKSPFPAPSSYTPIKNTLQVNKVYKTY